MKGRVMPYTSKPPRGFLQVCADWHLTTALSIITLIMALNISFPELSDPTTLSLSTYHTRVPTVQYNNPIPKFIYLSYFNPRSGEYFKGNDDMYFVVFWILIWLSVRELMIRYFWKPFGGSRGIKEDGKLQRFAEQGFNAAYYILFWIIGMTILTKYPSSILSLNIRQYWQDYPHDSLPALTKFYYLTQTAFWFQQLIVINLEKRRKDHVQMFIHHIVTIILMCASYAINFTGTGIVIHVTMDLADIFLFLGKLTSYAGITSKVTDSIFGLFVISWIYTRHYVFGKIIYAIYTQVPQDINLESRASEGRLGTYELWVIFLVLLGFLQMLLIVWLVMILRTLKSVLTGNRATDCRSDSEDSDDESVDTRMRIEDQLRSSEKGALLDDQSDNSLISSTPSSPK